MPSDRQLRKLKENWASSKLNDTTCKLQTGTYKSTTQTTCEIHSKLKRLCETFATVRATSQDASCKTLILETETI